MFMLLQGVLLFITNDKFYSVQFSQRLRSFTSRKLLLDFRETLCTVVKVSLCILHQF